MRESHVAVYVRHKADCPHKGEGFFRRCDCPKWVRYSGDACLCGYSHKGRQHRISAETVSWMLAEEKALELQRRLNSGETTTVETNNRRTISDELATYLLAKKDEGLSPQTLRKLKYQLTMFEQFMSDRGKFFPSDITPADVIDFRACWKWESGVTRQKAQQNLRGFLRLCCKNNSKALLDVLKPIKLSKTDISRLKPQPFSEAELTNLLVQVPKTFPDAVKAARLTALIHLQVSTGLAIRDAVQLQRQNLRDGWLRIERQKTNKPVAQKIHPSLYQELLAVTNGDPKYVFWNGKCLPESATGLWQRYLLTLMKDAGVWIKGNLSHRFRDTAVDFWLEQGCSMNEIAASLGDTVQVVEKHYADLMSKRMEERLAKMPTRQF